MQEGSLEISLDDIKRYIGSYSNVQIAYRVEGKHVDIYTRMFNCSADVNNQTDARNLDAWLGVHGGYKVKGYRELAEVFSSEHS